MTDFPNREAYGRCAYEAYAKAIHDMPPWVVLPPAVQEGWNAAAEAACDLAYRVATV